MINYNCFLFTKLNIDCKLVRTIINIIINLLNKTDNK